MSEEVDARIGELGQNHVQRARAVHVQEKRDRRLEFRPREHGRMSLSTDEREDRLVAEVVLDVVGVNLRAVDFRGEGVRDARRMDISCREARALGGGRCGHGRAAGELLRHEAATLGEPCA